MIENFEVKKKKKTIEDYSLLLNINFYIAFLLRSYHSLIYP